MRRRFLLLALCLALCLTALPAGAEAAFTDITDQTMATAAAALEGMGIVSGTSETTFNPTGGLSRAQLCAMLVGAVGLSSQVGTYERTRNHFGFVIPDDTKLAQDIYVESEVYHPWNNFKTFLATCGRAKMTTLSPGIICTLPLAMMACPSRMIPPTLAFVGKPTSAKVLRVTREPASATTSKTSASDIATNFKCFTSTFSVYLYM